MMRDDGRWITPALKVFAEIANSEKVLESDYPKDSPAAVPVIHSMWTRVALCGQPVPESRFELLAVGNKTDRNICPLIYHQPANKVAQWGNVFIYIYYLTPPVKRWKI